MKIKDIPPIYFYVGFIIISVTRFIFPSFNMIQFPYNLLGIILILLGAYLNLSSVKLFKKYKTPHKFQPSNYVIQDGVFSFSRNPIYLGMVLLLIGYAVILQNLISLVIPLIFFLIIHFKFIPYEENKMKKELGDEYLEYEKKVRKWL